MKLFILLFALSALLSCAWSQEAPSAEYQFQEGRYLNESTKYGSIDYFDNALSPKYSNADAWNDQGQFLNNMSKFEEAIDYFDRALQLNSSNSDFWINKGWSLYNIGKINESLKCYNMALELDPLNSSARNKRDLAQEKLLSIAEKMVESAAKSGISLDEKNAAASSKPIADSSDSETSRNRTETNPGNLIISSLPIKDKANR